VDYCTKILGQAKTMKEAVTKSQQDALFSLAKDAAQACVGIIIILLLFTNFTRSNDFFTKSP
jgi:hypothetical protein